jgi:hypothetical protein
MEQILGESSISLEFPSIGNSIRESADNSAEGGPAVLPIWSLWFSTLVLSITFAIGLPCKSISIEHFTHVLLV